MSVPNFASGNHVSGIVGITGELHSSRRQGASSWHHKKFGVNLAEEPRRDRNHGPPFGVGLIGQERLNPAS